MKTRNAFNRFVCFGAGIIFSLLLVSPVVKAQCPTDIPVPGTSLGNTTTGWVNQTAPFVDYIQGTECLIDMYYCQRTITDQYGNFVQMQYFVYKVVFDPSGDPTACDGITPQMLIKDGIEGMFQKFSAYPCSSYSKVVTVYRRSCWEYYFDNQSVEYHPPVLIGCDASPECGKTCLVCYDGSRNRTISCTYTGEDVISGCELSLPTNWSYNTCYYIHCGD